MDNYIASSRFVWIYIVFPSATSCICFVMSWLLHCFLPHNLYCHFYHLCAWLTCSSVHLNSSRLYHFFPTTICVMQMIVMHIYDWMFVYPCRWLLSVFVFGLLPTAVFMTLYHWAFLFLYVFYICCARVFCILHWLCYRAIQILKRCGKSSSLEFKKLMESFRFRIFCWWHHKWDKV